MLIDSSEDLTRPPNAAFVENGLGPLVGTSGAVDRPRPFGADREDIAHNQATPSVK